MPGLVFTLSYVTSLLKGYLTGLLKIIFMPDNMLKK